MTGRAALLVMDVMPLVVPAFGGDDALLDRLACAVDAARRATVPVIFVRVAFRPGYPEVSRSNATFSRVRKAYDFTEPNPATGIHSAVQPRADEMVVTKRRVSAFSGSDLEVVLRSLEVRTLVLAGVRTSGVVLSTVRQAADLDYELVVLADGCADADQEVHDLLMTRVFPSQALVMTVGAWGESLGTHADRVAVIPN